MSNRVPHHLLYKRVYWSDGYLWVLNTRYDLRLLLKCWQQPIQIPFSFLQELDCIWWLHYWCRSDELFDDLIQKKCFKNAEASKMRCASFFSFQLLHQRFSIPVLSYPRSAHFVCFSYRFRRLFYSTVSALRSGHHMIFRHDSSSKRTYMFHSKGI